MIENIDTETGLLHVLSRIVAMEDNDRLRSMTGLINTFNFAIQVQSKRQNWEPKDFRLFAIALCAMDQIGKETNGTQK